MADTGIDKLAEQFNYHFEIECKRLVALDAMEEGLIKDWITSLVNENKSLNDHNTELSHRLGVTAFSPRGR